MANPCKAHIIVTADNPEQASELYDAGADYVLRSAKLCAERILEQTKSCKVSKDLSKMACVSCPFCLPEEFAGFGKVIQEKWVVLLLVPLVEGRKEGIRVACLFLFCYVLFVYYRLDLPPPTQ